MRDWRFVLLLAVVSSGRLAVWASPAQATGRFSEFPIPAPGSYPIGIAAGPDGNLWFTEYYGEIGRVTTSGGFTEFRIPTPNSDPDGSPAVPHRNLGVSEGVSRR